MGKTHITDSKTLGLSKTALRHETTHSGPTV
jgi:hypothetical protein